MRQILLAGLPPKTGEWLAYRLRGETVEVLFSADDLVARVRSECAPSLVVLSACGPVERAEQEVARVRAACGPAVPMVVEVDSGQASVSPGVLGRLTLEHGVRRVVPSTASRADLLSAVLAYLPDAAPPRPPVRKEPFPLLPVQPQRRFPDVVDPSIHAAAPSYRVPPPPPRIELGLGGVFGHLAPAAVPAPDGELEPLVLMDTSLPPARIAAPAPVPAPVVRAAVQAVPQGPSAPRPVLLVVSADPELYGAFAAAAGADYEVRAGRFGDLLRMEGPDEGAPAAVLVDVPAGQGGRVWKLLDRLCRRMPRLPVLVATCSDALEDRVNAVRVGAHACMHKPVAPEIARDVLERALPRRTPAAPRVLVVDDDAEVLRCAEGLFRRLEWEVRTVSEPGAVWDALASTRPDLLILASELAGMDGIDLCRAVRSDPRWRRLPVLFLTSSMDVPWLYRAYAAGADDHVAKPFWGPELVARARNRLRRAELACI